MFNGWRDPEILFEMEAELERYNEDTQANESIYNNKQIQTDDGAMNIYFRQHTQMRISSQLPLVTLSISTLIGPFFTPHSTNMRHTKQEYFESAAFGIG